MSPAWLKAVASLGAGPLLRALGDRAEVRDGVPRFSRGRDPVFWVLTYHRVVPEPGPFMIDAVSCASFESQMRHVARAYRPLSLRTLIEQSRGGELPSRAIAVTFDDGYADNFRYAAPILKRWGIPATVFLVTDCIGTAVVPWHDRVLRAFATATAVEAPLPGSGERLPLGAEAERRASAFRALAALKRMEEAERLQAVETIRDALGAPASQPSEALMLDWDQVRAMRQQGIEFGSHTVTHPILSRVTPERAWDEVHDSKRAIEASLGEEAALFAYPNGRSEDFTAENVAQIEDAGYRGALTTLLGPNGSESDPYRLRRGTPWRHDPAGFELQLALYRLRPTPEAPAGGASRQPTAPAGRRSGA